jgi:nucleotide-binding universal stress UspA family protein
VVADRLGAIGTRPSASQRARRSFARTAVCVKREFVGIKKRVKTIVVGYDASDAAPRVLDRAAELAEALAARLVVVSVSEAPLPAPVLERAGPMLVPGEATGPVLTGGTAPLAEPEPDPKELAQSRLEQARSTLASRSLDADYVAEVGSPAERLLTLAEERDAELIVVGRGEHGFLERLVAQPVDEAVARRAGRDVLIVH